MYRNEQEKEIATIAPKTFKISLSDTDVKRIFEKAGSVGLTPEELIEDFIGDLVDGTYTNGSDERYLAQDWYERCGFSFYGYGSLIYVVLRRFFAYAFMRNLDMSVEQARRGFFDTLRECTGVDYEERIRNRR